MGNIRILGGIGILRNSVIIALLLIMNLIFILSNSHASQPVHSVLAIDVSGSMSGKKLDEAKNAAKSYIDFINLGDLISIVAYSSDAKIIVPQKQINSNYDRIYVQKSIDMLTADGSTNIGAGIREGLKELINSKIPTIKNILLMTDGQHNTGELWPFVDQSAHHRVPIHTIGFGNDADMGTLCEISKRTGGFCFFADERNLPYIYHRTGLVVYNISTLFSFSDFIFSDKTYEYPVLISDDIKDIFLFLQWTNGQLSYEIIEKTGKKIRPEYEKSGLNYKIIKITDVPSSELTIRLHPRDVQRGTQVNVSISGNSPLYSSIVGLKPYYQPKENVEIKVVTGIVKNGTREPKDDISLRVEVIRPTETILKKSHRGIELNIVDYAVSQLFKRIPVKMSYYRDGIYIGRFDMTDLSGPYIVKVKVEATVDGKFYSREYNEIFHVGRVEESRITVGDLFSLLSNLKPERILEENNPFKKFKEKIKELPIPKFPAL